MSETEACGHGADEPRELESLERLVTARTNAALRAAADQELEALATTAMSYRIEDDASPPLSAELVAEARYRYLEYSAGRGFYDFVDMDSAPRLAVELTRGLHTFAAEDADYLLMSLGIEVSDLLDSRSPWLTRQLREWKALVSSWFEERFGR